MSVCHGSPASLVMLRSPAWSTRRSHARCDGFDGVICRWPRMSFRSVVTTRGPNTPCDHSHPRLIFVVRKANFNNPVDRLVDDLIRVLRFAARPAAILWPVRSIGRVARTCEGSVGVKCERNQTPKQRMVASHRSFQNGSRATQSIPAECHGHPIDSGLQPGCTASAQVRVESTTG